VFGRRRDEVLNFGNEVDVDEFSAIKIKVKDYDVVGGDDRLGDILIPMDEIREAALGAEDGEPFLTPRTVASLEYCPVLLDRCASHCLFLVLQATGTSSCRSSRRIKGPS
jgi:hypothetical protein